jgi:type I restriction enzyme R subunit
MTTGIDAQTCKLIVLDSNIGSMTEFKQIIGRGTRIEEEYDKMYFTIMDFRNVTNLFADPEFDGDPVMIKEVKENDDISDMEDEKTETSITDIIDGEEIQFPYPEPITGSGDIIKDPKRKYYVEGISVNVINERVQYLDTAGKIITETLIDYTRKNVLAQYATLDSFLKSWNNAEKKKAIVDELEQQGIFFDALKEEIGKDYDTFDLICHVAYEAKPLTRKERANNVIKRNYFEKYGEQAQAVIQSLLEKYADSDIFSIESMEVLNQSPINQHGRPLEIINIFGSKEKYLQAIKELETELYRVA